MRTLARPVLSAVLLVALAACGDGPTGPGADVSGEYALTGVNGSAPPATIHSSTADAWLFCHGVEGDEYREVVLASTMTLERGGAGGVVTSGRSECYRSGVRVSEDPWTDADEFTWTRSGNRVRITALGFIHFDATLDGPNLTFQDVDWFEGDPVTLRFTRTGG